MRKHRIDLGDLFPQSPTWYLSIIYTFITRDPDVTVYNCLPIWYTLNIKVGLSIQSQVTWNISQHISQWTGSRKKRRRKRRSQYSSRYGRTIYVRILLGYISHSDLHITPAQRITRLKVTISGDFRVGGIEQYNPRLL